MPCIYVQKHYNQYSCLLLRVIQIRFALLKSTNNRYYPDKNSRSPKLSRLEVVWCDFRSTVVITCTQAVFLVPDNYAFDKTNLFTSTALRSGRKASKQTPTNKPWNNSSNLVKQIKPKSSYQGRKPTRLSSCIQDWASCRCHSKTRSNFHFHNLFVVYFRRNFVIVIFVKIVPPRHRSFKSDGAVLQ